MNIALRPLTLTLLCGMAAAGHAGEPITETRRVDADAVISIELLNGQVSISGHDAQDFSIEGTLNDAAEGYILRESNGNIHFEEIIERHNGRWWAPGRGGNDSRAGAVLDIRVPRGSVLRFDGTNADLDIADLQGNTDVEVINGRITASRLDGVVRLETVNGSIDSEQLSGRFALETVNGNIDDRNSAGTRAAFSAVNGSIRSDTRSPHITASNVNGEIALDLHSLDELEVSTVSGSIDVFGMLNDGAHVEMSSVGGRVELSLPLSTSASFQVSTAVGGRIRNELSDAEPVQKNRYVNSRELDFSINGGRGNVDISTVSGSVTLRACSQDHC